MTSIRTRLFVILLLATGAIWVSAVLWIQHSTRQQVGAVLDRRLEESARMVASLVGRSGAPVELPLLGLSDQAPALAGSGPHDISRQLICQVWGFDGRLKSGSAGAPDARLADGAPGYSERAVAGETWRVYTHVDPDLGIRVMIGDALSIRERLVNDVVFGLLAPAILILPLLALLIWWAVRRGLEPLDRLARDLSRRPANDLQPLHQASTAAELRPMIDALNGLFHRMAALRDRERNFTAFAAHELKTPLAGLKTQAQVAAIAPDAETRTRALRQIKAGVDRTDRMVRQLLDMTATETDVEAPQHTLQNGATILREVSDSLAGVAAARDVRVEVSDKGMLWHTPQGTLLATALRNLLENAIFASPSGEKVEATMDRAGDGLRFRILDRGPGIPESDRPRVTERFYRCASSPSGGGSGLGLAIVAAAADRLGGELRLSPRPGGGECAELVLSATEPALRTA